MAYDAFGSNCEFEPKKVQQTSMAPTNAPVVSDPFQPASDIAQRADQLARRAINVSRNISI
jgi:hypothetical protein